MTKPEWGVLANPEQAELRRSTSKEQVLSAIESEVESMQLAIKSIRQILLVSGLTATDLFHDMRRETAFSKEETQLAPRVRMDERRGTPSYYWERTIRHAYPLNGVQTSNFRSKTRSYKAFVRRRGTKTKERMQVYLLSEHVPVLKKSQSVSMKVFAQEPEWVRTAAALIEPQLAELRRLSSALSDVSRSLGRFDRMLHKQADNGR